MSNKFLALLANRMEESGNLAIPFGIYGLINRLILYPAWIYTHHDYYYPHFLRDIVAILLCLGLILKKRWPNIMAPYFPLYFYFCIFYILPFLTTYFFLGNHDIATELLDIMLTIFILFMVVDWLSLIILLILGISCGVLSYYLTQGVPMVSWAEYQWATYTLLWSVVAGSLLAHNAARYRISVQLKKQVATIQTVCASIAHELRTPLLSIKMGASGIATILPKLIAGYRAASEANLDIPTIYPAQLTQLEKVTENIDIEVNFSNMVINTLLTNTNVNLNTALLRNHLILASVEEAMLRYPFNPKELVSKIHLNRENNFYYTGDELLITHVMFNLIKNSLYAMAQMEKGEIFIWFEQDGKYNTVHFKDTAKGLDATTIESIFTPFYSNKPNHHGIGLTFCKLVMTNLHGNVKVKSVEGEYTEFILEFPKKH
jgi:signal transduction histidine kinase